MSFKADRYPTAIWDLQLIIVIKIFVTKTEKQLIRFFKLKTSFY